MNTHKAGGVFSSAGRKLHHPEAPVDLPAWVQLIQLLRLSRRKAWLGRWGVAVSAGETCEQRWATLRPMRTPPQHTRSKGANSILSAHRQATHCAGAGGTHAPLHSLTPATTSALSVRRVTRGAGQKPVSAVAKGVVGGQRQSPVWAGGRAGGRGWPCQQGSE
jgi:hypothetical protein